jgi:hypothetical protein
MEICGVGISDGWRALLLVWPVLLLLFGLGIAIGHWSDRRYERRSERPETRWRTREEREAEDDGD